MEPTKLKNKEYWDKQVELNSTDDYSKGVLDAARAIMISLDNGDDCKTAHDKMYGMGLTGFMAGAAVNMTYNAHERGEEFKNFWNEKWGIKDKEAKGTVNPAILTAK